MRRTLQGLESRENYVLRIWKRLLERNPRLKQGFMKPDVLIHTQNQNWICILDGQDFTWKGTSFPLLLLHFPILSLSHIILVLALLPGKLALLGTPHLCSYLIGLLGNIADLLFFKALSFPMPDFPISFWWFFFIVLGFYSSDLLDFVFLRVCSKSSYYLPL